MTTAWRCFRFSRDGGFESVTVEAHACTPGGRDGFRELWASGTAEALCMVSGMPVCELPSHRGETAPACASNHCGLYAWSDPNGLSRGHVRIREGRRFAVEIEVSGRIHESTDRVRGITMMRVQRATIVAMIACEADRERAAPIAEGWRVPLRLMLDDRTVIDA